MLIFLYNKVNSVGRRYTFGLCPVLAATAKNLGSLIRLQCRLHTISLTMRLTTFVEELLLFYNSGMTLLLCH